MLKKCLIAAGLLLISTTKLAAGDGTLPVILDGKSIMASNNDSVRLETRIELEEAQTVSNITIPCSLRGSGVREQALGGYVQVGDTTYDVSGSCYDSNTEVLELNAFNDQASVKFIGKLREQKDHTHFKGVVTVKDFEREQKLKFHLQ